MQGEWSPAMTVVAEDISLGQFVKQLAALLQKDNVALPFKNQRSWHLLFYTLKKKPGSPGKPAFFDRLVFDWDASYPKCRELSEFLNALHFTASVSARNPSFEVISVDPDVADQWTKNFGTDDPAVKEFVASAIEAAKIEFAQSSAH
jgi:hypothetical protein